MTKRFISLLLSLLIALSLCACSSNASVSTASTAEPIEAEEPVLNEEEIPSESEAPIPEIPEDEGSEEVEESGPAFYSNTVYYVGDDIPEDGYVITCTNTNFSMEVVVFESDEAYRSFQNAKKSTIGEYSIAIEQNAWANFYLYQDEQVYVGLRKGNVILLDDGFCEFTRFNPSDSNTVYSGIYVIGEDIEPSKLTINCVSEYLSVTVFETKDKYLNYHKTHRFTIGEENDALNANAESSTFFYEGHSTYVNLRDGMILIVDKGIGESTIDSGPKIN